MDLRKIGKFISVCRKEKNITQNELAEKLGISDRAISKWENGNCLPDASKMLDLCGILGITVNELLNGERVEMKDYSKKTDELLVELAKQEEKKNKRLLSDMYIMTVSAIIFYVGIVTLASYTLKEGSVFLAIICAATVLTFVVAFYGLKLEAEAGYYECKKCHNRFVPKSYFSVMIAPHFNTTRFLKCPDCGKRTWAKKVMTKK